ncbi:hypothetical protein BP5796_02052 [Coleophoma crateriformis]|uniref:TLC domain-containing protein n=1 Tax=Coleophoma crateriformis TaxID=565419 RepID=A0A3D8T3T4_9HELO|nr:hypothetical protein BP5796_02052 [Coleophoma crateriformis]
MSSMDFFRLNMSIPIFLSDVSIAAIAFGTTHVLYKTTRHILKTNLSTWEQVKPSTQNRMACEIALLPSRAAMGICCAPIVMNAFIPTSNWQPLDTYRAIWACAIMAGSYCYDLTIERADVLSLIHHCFGPAMLLWIRIQFSSFTTNDAPMIRLLISFVFFGATMGGTFTTCILTLLNLIKPHLSKHVLHTSISILVWTLFINTFVATTFGSMYMAVWEVPLFGYWGYYGLIPMALSGFEYYLQWRWAFKFQTIYDRLRLGIGKSESINEAKMAAAPGRVKGVGATMKDKYFYLRCLLGCWMVSYIGLYLRVLQFAVRDVRLIMA